AEMFFAEGDTARAQKGLAFIRNDEIKLLNENLDKMGVSGEMTDFYKQYRAEQESFYAAAKKRETLWSPPKQIDPFPASFEPTRTYYIAPDGNANNDGSKESPFATLQQARDAIRQFRAKNDGKLPKGGIEVVIRGGKYPVTETFTLEENDSGTAESPIVYRAADDENPIFTGGIAVSSPFNKVTDSEILSRLPSESHSHVLVADIPKDVVFPSVEPRGYGRNGLGTAPAVRLFIDNIPQQIARYPNAAPPVADDPLVASEKSFLKTGKVHRGHFDTPESGKPGIFDYSDPRVERWTSAPDAMVFGYWGHLWGSTSCKVEKIDAGTKQIILSTNNPYGYRENMPYYAFNLLEEIDMPGEWYLDRANSKLYLFAPNGVDLQSSEIRLCVFPKNFFSLQKVGFTTFLGLTFEEGSGNAGIVQNGTQIRFVGCQFNRFGNWGIGLHGTENLVLSCDFRSLGGGGVKLDGGDIKTLVPGNNQIDNTLVDGFTQVDFAYAPAVELCGVGNKLTHNLFCDSPGHAIRIEGMEHLVEFCEIHSVVYESDDQAGIDIWGNPYIRGMVYRYNYWHHIGSGRDVAGQSGIRLDDMISSVLIYGNVFFRSSGGQFGGVQIHGGKDTIVDSNLMIDCKYAVSFSPWGPKRWTEMLEGYFGKKARESGFGPENDVYRSKYSDYADIINNADRNFITRNAAIGCDAFARNNRANVLLDNVMLPWMPELFLETKGMSKKGEARVPSDARKVRQKLSIPFDSPIYELLGIMPLPVEFMGIYSDAIRKTLPKTEVTPYFVLE
ncbi:MAG: right-handed parallel beta-helix repeat-containing protein, partial [Thermoguttaceae bacterium]